MRIFQNVGLRTNTFSHTLNRTHNPSNTSTHKKTTTNDTTSHLKHCKYHFPPPTIIPTTMYVPSFSINPHTLLHTPLLPVKFLFSWVLIIGLNTLHSSYLPSTLYLLLQ